jgi:hypothetical protein
MEIKQANKLLKHVLEMSYISDGIEYISEDVLVKISKNSKQYYITATIGEKHSLEIYTDNIHIEINKERSMITIMFNNSKEYKIICCL